MTAGVASQNRQYQRAEPYEADKLIGETCATLRDLGINISPVKVRKLVHRYTSRVAYTGYDYAAWMAHSIALYAEERARIAWTLRNRLGVVDVTGQRAARRADRALHLGEGWHD